MACHLHTIRSVYVANHTMQHAHNNLHCVRHFSMRYAIIVRYDVHCTTLAFNACVVYNFEKKSVFIFILYMNMQI